MQLTRWLSAALLLICLLAFGQRAALAADSASLDAPPPDLAPVTARLADILAQHDATAGSTGGATDSVIEKWTFTDTGISGTEQLERSGANYHSTITFGPFVEQYGQFDDKRWHQDFNGFTSPSSGVEGKSFAAVRVLEDAADPKNDVEVVGQTTGSNPAYVLKIRKPQDKHPEWMFYDKATGHVVRFEFVSRKRRIVQTYDDFRTTGGITEAWHIHDSDGRTELDDDWHLAAVQHGATIPDSRFAAPPNDRKSDVSGRAPIPSVFVGYDTTVLRVQVGGRGLDFELDASEPQSIIERSVAESMGLPTFGQVTRLRDGTPVGYETILPDATIGPAHLHDFRIRSESFTYLARQDTRVVGVLGYDFLASHVVHVDFVHKLVEIFPTDSFGANKPVDGGLDLPISFDNGLLLVPMDFGSTFTDRVIVNNSFPYTVAFGSLFEQHPSDFSVVWSNKKSSNVPFADGDTVGQRMEIMVARTPSLRFAIADFGDHPLLATNASYDASETKVDAMIGADYLRFFDLYFDYPHGRFIVKPNERTLLSDLQQGRIGFGLVKPRTIAALVALAYGGIAVAPVVAAGPVDMSAPPGIGPASISLATLLSRNKFAVGKLNPGTARTRVEHWTLSYGSLTGTRDEWRNGADYRITQVLGPNTESYGVSSGRHWQQNSNGQVTFENGLHERDAADEAALRASSASGVTLLGRTAKPVDAYVVKVDPPGGRLEYVFYDATTWFIDRIEAIRHGRRTTTTYTDYRATKGLEEPWHVHWSDGFATNDGDEVLQSLAIGDAVAAAQTAIPSNGPPLFAAPSAWTTIPAAIEDDRIVVDAKLGGHSVHFLMDSGADGIVVDRDVIDAVGIKRYGKMTGETAGAYAESSAVIPELTVGPLALHNVHVSALPFVQYAADGKPVAGLLGYDFIANAVWHVDYQHGTVAAIDPQSFVPPPGSKALSVRFDDRVPTVTASLANASVPAMIVDTGADRSALFSSFLQAGGKSISDRGLGTSMRASWPFVDAMEGVGGSVDYRPLQAGPLALGAWTFPKWLFYVTQDAPAFEFEDYDGLIGQDMLRNFDLYLDYAHSKLYLVPNDRFRQRWTT